MKLNLTQKIAYNFFFSVGARIIGIALAFVIIKLTAEYLKLRGFGDYTTVTTFVYFFSVMADLGLYSIVVREISREGADEEKIVNNALTFRIVAGFFILGSAYFVSLLFPYSEDVKKGIAVAAIGFWVMSNIQVLIGLFQKYLVTDKIAISETIGRAVQLIFIWYFIKLDYGFLYIILTIFLGAAVNFILVLYFASKYIKIRLSFDFKFWKKLLKESFPLAVSAILVLIYFKIDTIFLSVMKDSEAVGVYGLSYKIMENLIFFPAMIVGLTMPIISKSIFADRKRFESIAQRTFDFLMIAVVPLIFGVVMTSDKMIKLLSSQDFKDSPAVMNILVIALGFIFFGALFSNIIIAAGKQKQLAQIYFAGAVFNVAANFIFIPRYSYFGAAFTTVSTEILVTLLMAWSIHKNLSYVPSFSIFYKALAASLAMAAAIYYFSYLNIFYIVALGIAVYIPAIYLIGGISKNEVQKLLKRDLSL